MEVDPQGRSAQEVIGLWDYVSDRLEKNFRRTIFASPAMPLTASGHRPAAVNRSGNGFGRRVVSS